MFSCQLEGWWPLECWLVKGTSLCQMENLPIRQKGAMLIAPIPYQLYCHDVNGHFRIHFLGVSDLIAKHLVLV